MAFDPIATLNEWKHKVASLQERWRGARREIEQLRQENEKLRRRDCVKVGEAYVARAIGQYRTKPPEWRGKA
jgi:hypothetical protein